MRYENQLNNYRNRNRGQDVDESTRAQVLESVWNQYIVDRVMIPQFQEVGITVGEDELYEAVVVNPVATIIQNITDPNTGKVSEQIARPDGSLDPVKWKQAVQNGVGEKDLRQLEEQVKSTRYFEKFRALVNKGLYITTPEAKEILKQDATQMTVKYVMKRYEEISDSTVKVTDSDLEKYYNDHSYEYIQKETTRSIEYVAFNVMPSPDDLAAIEKDANRTAQEFKGKTMSEDSVFMAQESENGNITIQNFTKKNMIVRDSSIYTAAPGTVFGPYNEGAYFKIYKLEGINSVADSARVRHILVGLNDPQSQQPKRSKAQAKREADSLLVLIKTNRVSFDSLVKNFSDDPGSKTNGGDYGWFDENEGFVEPFKNAGLMGTKGDISVVETQFGYHIIEVLDVSKDKHTSYKVAQIFKLIAPSEETNQKVFAKANQFGGENNTGDLFDKAIDKEKLTKRRADNIKEGDYRIAGIDGAKELTRWAYTANKGDVNIFSFPDKHVVVKLSGIKNKGILPLEEVKEDVTLKVMFQKKGEKLIQEFETKAGNAKTIEEVGTKMAAEVHTQTNLNFVGGHVEGAGQEKIFTGKAFGSKTGVISKPFADEGGAFVMTVVDKKVENAQMDLKTFQKDKERALAGRTDYAVFEALKEVSDIEFHKSRVD
jgi:peptidyl-prolyl cis-trans isomerase D